MANESLPPRKITSSVAKRKSDKTEIKELIQEILDSPIKKSPIVEVDGLRDISSFKNANTDVKTRILLQIAMSAMKGDKASAEFLMKYGGFEPAKEAKVTIDTPTFIEDMPMGDESQGELSAESSALPSSEETDELPIYVDISEAGGQDE